MNRSVLLFGFFALVISVALSVPAAAQFQIPRVAKNRKISPEDLRKFVDAHTTPRQFGFLGEPRVNVLELNRALDSAYPLR